MRSEDCGLIGGMHRGDWVGKDGSIDWLFMPRFDSDACFASILGDENNGCWQIIPAEPSWTSYHCYQGETLLLDTEFETPSGIVGIVDCMPINSKERQVIRVVEGRSGRVKMAMKLVIRFDHGLTVPWVRHEGNRVCAIAGPNALVLVTDVPTRGEGLSTVANFTIEAGEKKTFTLTWYPSHTQAPQTDGVL